MSAFVGGATIASFLMLALALVLTCARLLRGPHLADRVVALELLAHLLIAFTAVYAIATAEHTLLEVALAVALFSFLGTIAFARYIERTTFGDRGSA